MICFIIGSGSGLSPIRRRKITVPNTALLSTGSEETNFNRNPNIFNEENVFESFVCKISAILSRPQCVKDISTDTRGRPKWNCNFDFSTDGSVVVNFTGSSVINIFYPKLWHGYASNIGFLMLQGFNSSPPGQNGRHFADDMFKYILLNENVTKFRFRLLWQ